MIILGGFTYATRIQNYAVHSLLKPETWFFSKNTYQFPGV